MENADWFPSVIFRGNTIRNNRARGSLFTTPHAIVVENNLFVDCAALVSCTPWKEARWQEFVGKAMESHDIDRDLYLKRYPEMAGLLENANRNVIRRNLGWRCGELVRRDPGTLEIADNTLLGEGEFTWDPLQPPLDYPGFERIPFEEIGLYRDGAYRP